MLARVLLVIDDKVLRRRLRTLLTRLDCICEAVRGRRRLWERLSQGSGDLVIVDGKLMPEPVDDAIRLVKSAPEEPDVVLLEESTSDEDRARFQAAGCKAVLPPDLDDKLFIEVFESVLQERQEIMAARLTTQRLDGEPRLSDFVSSSPAMQTFMNVVERVARSDSTLLIQGETGVGKERLARAIHAEGRRSEGPFVAVNCGALPESLLESELFGHEEGAFTGATRARRGWFELAHEGTVFLDEIGELALHLQVKLLRVLQDHQIQRIGGEKAAQVNVRVMAATNRDLSEEVSAGRFRQDLYYRIGVVTLTLPPLRERREDITPLIENFVEYFQTVIGTPVDGIQSEALKALVSYDWPGNVRELANVVERAVLLTDGPDISLTDLPTLVVNACFPPVQSEDSAAFIPGGFLKEGWTDRPLKEVLKEVSRALERVYLDAVLEKTSGKVEETARRAGITSRSLFNKMQQYGLKKETYRKRSGEEKDNHDG